MKIAFWYIGKTTPEYLREGIAIFEKRLKRYLPFETLLIPDLKKTKNLSPREFKEKEGKVLLSKINPDDFLILLDEHGKQLTSKGFATFIEKKMTQSHKRIIFQIGGAYGFSEAVYQRANLKMSLSDMTFSHQMVRLFFLEQLYRAMTIIRNEPYHNE